MPGFGFAFQEAERLADCVRNRPLQLEDFATSPSREDNPSQPLRAAAGIDVLAQVGQRCGFPAPYLPEPVIDGRHRVGVRQDLRGFLQRLVLVDRNQHRRRPATPGHDHVFAEIGDAIDDRSKVASKLAYWDNEGHP